MRLGPIASSQAVGDAVYHFCGGAGERFAGGGAGDVPSLVVVLVHCGAAVDGEQSVAPQEGP